MIQSCDFAIIGAGVAGLGVGWKLAQAGMKVAIFERDTAGSGASHAAAGMLAPTSEVAFQEDDLLHLGLRSLALYPDFAAELQQASGVDVGLRQEGTLMVALDADDARKLDHLHQYRLSLGLRAEKLDAHQVRELEPGLVPSVHSALHVPTDHQVDPQLLIQALARAFQAAGGQLFEHTPVERVLVEGERVRGIRTASGDTVACAKVLVAAGAWTRALQGLPPGVLPHIRPVRGQMLSVALGTPALCRHVIRAPDAYLVPKASGRLIIGGTMEERGFDDQPTAGGIFELLRAAWETLPGIYDQHLLQTWVGFRPVSLNNLPLLGPTKVDGLWLAAGHGRNGILLTPITATAVSQAILSGTPPDILRGFTPT